jgi:hypothetical protein
MNTFATRRSFTKPAVLAGAWLAAAQAADTPAGTLFNARQLGAKGDSKTDDTKPIQTAIDMAAERGGAVFVPPGVYLTAELQLRPNVAVIGVPAWDYRHGGGSSLRLADPAASCLLNITGAFGATIAGLTLDGARLGNNIHRVLLNKPHYRMTVFVPVCVDHTYTAEKGAFYRIVLTPRLSVLIAALQADHVAAHQADFYRRFDSEILEKRRKRAV